MLSMVDTIAGSSNHDLSLDDNATSESRHCFPDPFMGAHHPDETMMQWQPQTRVTGTRKPTSSSMKALAMIDSAQSAAVTARSHPRSMAEDARLDKNAHRIRTGHQGSVLEYAVLPGRTSLEGRNTRSHYANLNDDTGLDIEMAKNDDLSPENAGIKLKNRTDRNKATSVVQFGSHANHTDCMATSGSKRPADDDSPSSQVAMRRRRLNSEGRGIETLDSITDCSQVAADDQGANTASAPAATAQSSDIDTPPRSFSVMTEGHSSAIITATADIDQQNASPESPPTPEHKNTDCSAKQHTKKPPKPDLNRDTRLSAAERQQRFDAFMATSCIPQNYFASAGMEPRHEAHAAWRALYEQAWRQMWKEHKCPILHIRTMVRMAHSMPIEGPLTPKATPPHIHSVCNGPQTVGKIVAVATTKQLSNGGSETPTLTSRQRCVAAVALTGQNDTKSDPSRDGKITAFDMQQTLINECQRQNLDGYIDGQRLQFQANGDRPAKASNHTICPPSPSFQSPLDSSSRPMLNQSTLRLQSPQQMGSLKMTMPQYRGVVDPMGVMHGGMARKEEAHTPSLQGLTMDTRTGLLYMINSSGHRVPIGAASPIQNSGPSLAIPPSRQQDWVQGSYHAQAAEAPTSTSFSLHRSYVLASNSTDRQ